MTPPQQRQQPAYDPMAQMMQILQLVMGQNQQAQQAQHQNRSFQLDKQQLAQRGQQFDQQFAAQEAGREQQQQQAILAALSRVGNKDGFQDPTALYQYLQQMGIQLPGMAQARPQVDPQKAQAQAQWAEMQQKLLQQ